MKCSKCGYGDTFSATVHVCMTEERKQKLAELDEFHRNQVKDLTRNRIRKLAVSNGIYDCITDPYDKLKNGDSYSSVMIDLEKFANLIIDECANVCVKKYANSDAISAQCGINFANDIKQHFERN